MDTESQSAADRVYEDFEPYYEWTRDEGSVIVLLPGYRRDHLKVQITSKPALKLKGERQITENKWRRFDIEFPIPSDYDTENVSAKFEGGRLYVKFAKLVKPKETTNPPEEAPRPEEPTNPPEEAPRPEEPTNPPEEAPRPKETSQKIDQQKAAQERTPKEEDKAEATTHNEVSDQKTPHKEKEPSDEKEKSETETAASIDKVAQKKVRTNGLTEADEAATSKVPQTKDVKPITRSKTRLLDFTISLRPFNQLDNEAHEDLDARLNKRKKLVKWVVLILLVVGLGLCARNAFRSSNGGSKFLEL